MGIKAQGLRRGAPREHLLMAATIKVSIAGINLFLVALTYFGQDIVLSRFRG